jgi:hypothetical protein
MTEDLFRISLIEILVGIDETPSGTKWKHRSADTPEKFLVVTWFSKRAGKMSKQDYDILEEIHSKVNDWLKFAEAKNAGLLALTAGMAYAFLTHSEKLNTVNCFCWLYFWSFAIFLALALILLLVSLLPQTKIFWSWPEKSSLSNCNLWFYGDLAHVKDMDLVKALYPAAEDNKVLYRHMRDIANQIITNSRIALRKYKYFNYALFCLLSAILTPLVGLPIFVLFHPHSRSDVQCD